MARKIILISFSLLWIFIIFAEYLYQHPAYSSAITNFQYYGFLALMGLGIGGFAYLRYQDKGKTKSYKALNGLGIFGLMYLMVLILTAFFFAKFESADFTLNGAGRLTIYFVGVALATYLCIGFVYLLGDLLLILFPLKMAPRELFIVKIAVGIMVLVALMFLLGSIHVLYVWSIAPLFIATVLLNLKGGKAFVQKSLLDPIELSPQLNLLGIASFAVVLVFVTLNFTQIVRPIAIGFDAMTLYMRLPSLMSDYHGLVDGHGTYNWSIFMSLGFIVFDSTAVSLALSFIGGPLALFALYALSRRWMNTNLSLLVLALLYSMPQINYLSFQDMKIDLGLLFISLCTLLLLVNWINPYEKEREEMREAGGETQPLKTENRKPKQKKGNKKPGTKKSAPSRKKKAQKKATKELNTPAFLLKLADKIEQGTPKILEGQGMMVWLGVMAGFATGVKLTSIMLFFGLFVVIWFVKVNAWASLGTILLAVSTILILKLDLQSGIRGWHASVDILQWILGVIGAGILVWQGIKAPQPVLANIKRSLVVIVFFVVAMSPWFIKNFSETGDLSVNGLLNGKKAVPSMNAFKLEDIQPGQD